MKSDEEKTIPKPIEAVIVDQNPEIRDGFHIKKKAPSLTGKKKVRVNSRGGYKYSPKYNKAMKVEQSADQDSDWYSKIVTDPDTGEIVHRCEEPLSQHRNHGSAKPKKLKSNC